MELNKDKIIDKLSNLKPDEKNIIFQLERKDSTINVYEYNNFRWLTLDSDLIQSIICLTDPSHVYLPYTQSMLLALTFSPEPSRILNLGSGCGTFERFFLKHYPETIITSVELDQDIVDISKNLFHTPHNHPVTTQSAEDFLNNNQDQYDIIFFDLHDGQSHPDCLNDINFYNKIDNILSTTGIFVINIIPSNQDTMLKLLLSMRKVFKWQHLLDFDNYGNILLYLHKKKPNPLQSYDTIIERIKQHSNIDLSEIIHNITTLPEVNKQTRITNAFKSPT